MAEDARNKVEDLCKPQGDGDNPSGGDKPFILLSDLPAIAAAAAYTASGQSEGKEGED